MKLFLEANQAQHAELQHFKGEIDSLSDVIERMTFSARTKQTLMPTFFPPAAGAPAGGGA
jgi:predicted CopG family antitoxin